MSKSPKYFQNQFLVQKKFLINANLTKRNNNPLKSNKFIPYEIRLKQMKRQRFANNQNKSMNGGLRSIIKNPGMFNEDSTNSKRDKRITKSLDLRRKENGNYIASIYPPEVALTRPRVINDNIEQELIEFMQENEEKYRNSVMNQKFVFPRKYILKAEESVKESQL